MFDTERGGRAWQLPPLPWNSMETPPEAANYFNFMSGFIICQGIKRQTCHTLSRLLSRSQGCFSTRLRRQGCEFQALPAASPRLFPCCPFSPPLCRNKSIPPQVTPGAQKLLVASREGALGCSARVWDIPAQFPGLPQTAGWEGQACSSSSRRGVASVG